MSLSRGRRGRDILCKQRKEGGGTMSLSRGRRGRDNVFKQRKEGEGHSL